MFKESLQIEEKQLDEFIQATFAETKARLVSGTMSSNGITTVDKKLRDLDR